MLPDPARIGVGRFVPRGLPVPCGVGERQRKLRMSADCFFSSSNSRCSSSVTISPYSRKSAKRALEFLHFEAQVSFPSARMGQKTRQFLVKSVCFCIKCRFVMQKCRFLSGQIVVFLFVFRYIPASFVINFFFWAWRSPNLNVVPPSWRLKAGWKQALPCKLGNSPCVGRWVLPFRVDLDIRPFLRATR